MRARSSDTGLLDITWVNYSELAEAPSIGVGGLPGMKFKNSWRDLETDIGTLKDAGFTHVFCLCKPAELKYFRVRDLLETYEARGFVVHHHPIEFGMTPTMTEMKTIVHDLQTTVLSGNKVYLHGKSTLGRVSVVLAALLLEQQANLTADDAMTEVKMLLGPGAFQTIRVWLTSDCQNNFIEDYNGVPMGAVDR